MKKTKARVNHSCDLCNVNISKGQYYYREDIVDEFLYSLHAKKYCKDCVEKYKKQLPEIREQ